MKIGIDFRMGGSMSSGIGRYVFELLKAILKIDSENRYFIFYNKHHVAREDLAALQEHENVELVETDIRHYSLAEQLVFPKILNKYDLDLVHFPNFNVPIRYKGKYVVTIHDMVHHRLGGAKKTHLLHFKAYQYVIQKAAERSLKILTPSESSLEDIAHYFPHVKNKIQVIHEGVTLAPQTQEHVDKLRETFLLRRPYFLFVGTLERKKNIVTLARGFDEFIEKYKLDMDLVFAGKPDSNAPDEKHKALDIGHKDRLVFTGFVSDADLAALYQGAYAFVSASLNEGFGLPGVEAMQFALPLLVSNSPVFNEIYDQAAIYFDGTSPTDIAEKMKLLAQDKQFYEQQRTNSLERSEFFSWDKAAQETLAVYKHSVDEKKIEQAEEAIPED